MQIAVGHANPDFDAYAATVAATKLFPGARGVFLGSQNANVRSFHNLHEGFLEFVELREVDFDDIDRVIMVDTRDPDRIGQFGEVAERPDVEVIVYDHHPSQEGDIEGADDRSMPVGATTSILVHEIERRGIELTPLEASVMLLGVHEDTGSLTFPSATAYDAEAATFLMSAGADLEVVNQFLQRALDPMQRELLAQLTDSLEVWDVHGQPIAVGTANADDYVDSASVLTHYVVEDMGYRVAVAIVQMPQRLQVVARSRIAAVDVGAAMARIGGGGHPQAASAGFRELTIPQAIERVREALEAEVRPPLRAADIMSSPVRTIGPQTSMQQAGEIMATWGHGGLPIVDDGRLVGMVTRKDVDKAARHGLAHAPVTGFMARDVITVEPDEDLQALERLLATRGIGRTPVMDESGTLRGIVTRKDLLRAEHGDAYLDRRLPRAHSQATERFQESFTTLLPADVRSAVGRIGAMAEERGLRAHLVGGIVRDLLIGTRNLDVDVVVEGDAVMFAEAAAAALGARVRPHHRFGTAVLVLGDDFHIDVTSARAEFYERPGALPTVERSSLRQDLFRRDFTINAMAACVNPDCMGAIADPFGGLRDLEDRVIRVLHALSFVEDPTRLLRSARFEARYGFTMSETTEQLARRAVEMNLLDEVSGARIREELLDIYSEADPVAVFERLDELGALDELLPVDVRPADALAHVAAAESAWRELETLLPTRPDRVTTLVTATSAGAGREAAERWVRHVRLGKSFARPIVELASRGPSTLRLLQDRRGMRDSRLYRALVGLRGEVLVVLWALGDALARERVEHFVRELATVRPAVDGRDLVGLGYAPSERFTDILSRALDARLDGKAVGREAELANLARIAARSGLERAD